MGCCCCSSLCPKGAVDGDSSGLRTPLLGDLPADATQKGEAKEEYDFGELLGRGVSGSVYKAKHRRTGKEFAIKVVLKSKLLDEEDRRAFAREMKVLGLVRHPNIIQLEAAWESDDKYELVTELAKGGEVAPTLAARGTFSEVDAARIIKTVASALAYLHGRGVVHRDIKPENLVFLDEAATVVKLVDLGSGAFCAHASGSGGSRTNTPLHDYVGSRPFMAPELFTRAQRLRDGYGVEVDVWALGIMAFLLLAGRWPFDDGRGNLSRKLAAQGAEALHFDAQDDGASSVPIPEPAQDLIRSMLEVTPAKRIKAKAICAHPWILAMTMLPDGSEGAAHGSKSPSLRVDSRSGGKDSAAAAAATAKRETREGSHAAEEGLPVMAEALAARAALVSARNRRRGSSLVDIFEVRRQHRRAFLVGAAVAKFKLGKERNMRRRRRRAAAKQDDRERDDVSATDE